MPLAQGAVVGVARRPPRSSAVPPEGGTTNGVAARGALFVRRIPFQILNLENIFVNLAFPLGWGVASLCALAINSLWQWSVVSGQLLD
jgi:hypothetical protein